MKIPPESYGFMLENEYKAVKHWLNKGKISPALHSIKGILNANHLLIKEWVAHNEAHKRQCRCLALQYKLEVKIPCILTSFVDYAQLYYEMNAAKKLGTYGQNV